MTSSTIRLHSRDGKTPPCRHFQPWRSLLREYTCMRSKRHWPLKIILYIIDFACVNAFVLWMLKYPDWQQKKNHRRCLYLLSLGEDMVRPYTRRAEVEMSTDILIGPREQRVSLANNSFPYSCEERWKKMAWKMLYLSNS